ncbi:MAG: LamG-like jellyroll fold domain-containing protein, partial [Prevotella sp.]
MGKAIVLNGTNQNILISTETIPVSASEDFSIEFWFKSGVQANKTMFSCGKGLNDLDSSSKLSVGFDASNKLTVYSNGNTHIIPNAEVQDNQWHHFALSVLRTGNANVLIDGVVKYQIAATKFGALGSNKISLGARYYK